VFVVDVCTTEFNVTDQLVPDTNPTSVNVTAYADPENVIVAPAVVPWTVTVPDDGLAVSPLITETAYENVPFTDANTTVVPVEPLITPFSVTAHPIPVVRPVSVNVTAFVVNNANVNVGPVAGPPAITML
jgi:hypothetical protein